MNLHNLEHLKIRMNEDDEEENEEKEYSVTDKPGSLFIKKQEELFFQEQEHLFLGAGR